MVHGRSCEKVGCGEKVWEDVRRMMLEMVGGVVRRWEVVRRFGKMLEKVSRVGRRKEMVREAERVIQVARGKWKDVRGGGDERSSKNVIGVKMS